MVVAFLVVSNVLVDDMLCVENWFFEKELSGIEGIVFVTVLATNDLVDVDEASNKDAIVVINPDTELLVERDVTIVEFCDLTNVLVDAKVDFIFDVAMDTLVELVDEEITGKLVVGINEVVDESVNVIVAVVSDESVER